MVEGHFGASQAKQASSFIFVVYFTNGFVMGFNLWGKMQMTRICSHKSSL